MIHCGAEIALKKNSLSNLYVIHDFMIVNKTKAHFTYDDIYWDKLQLLNSRTPPLNKSGLLL
jgi:hypothetical protein